MTTNPQPEARARVAAALREHGMVHLGDQVPADEYDCCAEAVLAVLPAPADRAAILREAADAIDATRDPFPIAVQNGITWATAELRRAAAVSGSGRVADETQAEGEPRCEKCPPADGADTVDWAEIDHRTAQSGIDTPECDCGHDGMGASWHSKDCEWRSALTREAPQPERPRCPHCQMPHDLTPDIAAVCASVRASVAKWPAVVSQPDGEA